MYYKEASWSLSPIGNSFPSNGVYLHWFKNNFNIFTCSHVCIQVRIKFPRQYFFNLVCPRMHHFFLSPHSSFSSSVPRPVTLRHFAITKLRLQLELWLWLDFLSYSCHFSFLTFFLSSNFNSFSDWSFAIFLLHGLFLFMIFLDLELFLLVQEDLFIPGSDLGPLAKFRHDFRVL